MENLQECEKCPYLSLCDYGECPLEEASGTEDKQREQKTNSSKETKANDAKRYSNRTSRKI